MCEDGSMTKIEITLPRALKIWWSFVWRAWVLLIPLMMVFIPVMKFIQPFQAGVPMNPANMPGFMGKFFLIWYVMMVGGILLQVVAIKWMIKTKWSDFELVALARPDAKAPLSA